MTAVDPLLERQQGIRKTLMGMRQLQEGEAVNRPKAIGTAAETALVRYLRVNGWGNAERRALAGGYDLGDVTGCPCLVWECKAGQKAATAHDKLIGEWLAQTETERRNALAQVGILVVKRAGHADPGSWWAIVPLDALTWPSHRGSEGPPVRLLLRDLIPILRGHGYGDPLEVSA